ncbi:MAG: nucleoside 2-deoxyribosyltransferase domain-containing protein [Synechococcales bacterium]|nr:nucleoside 2-deoxyribosyltransferase domain-containing protein [Synechococcales bacterium]
MSRTNIFLGGTCGTSTWRKEVAIPALEAAGLSFYNPQLDWGTWTEAHETAELAAKESAEVMLFIVTDQTRGVASLVEAAYLIGSGRSIALALMFIPEGAIVDGEVITELERRDLNRGRLFVRTLAQQAEIPVFDSAEAATHYAIKLLKHKA